MKKNAQTETLPIRIRANAEEEEFILGNRFDIAMPVFIRILDREGIYIECYPQVERLVLCHAEKYGRRILSNQSLRELHAALAPYLQKWGYEEEKNSMRRYEIYRSGEAQDEKMPLPVGVRRLTECDEDINRTTVDIEYAIENGATVFGYEENGEIISIAATHIYDGELPQDVEVMVETVPSARCRGLALACLCALKEELREVGYSVEYRCSTRNTASKSVAGRAGLLLVGQCHYYVLRAKG